MKIGKRDKQLQEFNEDKIRNAVLKAFASTQSVILEEHLASIRSEERRVGKECHSRW